MENLLILFPIFFKKACFNFSPSQRILGEPIIHGHIDLRDDYNRIYLTNLKIKIPVRGSNKTGTLFVQAKRDLTEKQLHILKRLNDISVADDQSEKGELEYLSENLLDPSEHPALKDVPDWRISNLELEIQDIKDRRLRLFYEK